MSFSYDSWVKRRASFCSFERDSFWSWLLVAVAFLNKWLNLGIMFALGAFFQSWKEEFGAEASNEMDDYNLEGLITMVDVNGQSAHNGSNAMNVSTSNVGDRLEVSDATLSWIQSCAISLCYMSAPLANAVLRHVAPRFVMIGVGITMCVSFIVAAFEGKGTSAVVQHG